MRSHPPVVRHRIGALVAFATILAISLAGLLVSNAPAQTPTPVGMGPEVTLPYVGFQPLRTRLPMRAFTGPGPERLPPIHAASPPNYIVPVNNTPQPGYPPQLSPSPAPAYETPQLPAPQLPPPQAAPTPPGETRPIEVSNRFIPPTNTDPSMASVPPPQVAPDGASAPAGDQQEFQVATDPIRQPIDDPVRKTGDQVDVARVVAMVGNQPILAGDLLGQINEVLRQNNVDKITPEQQDQLIRRFLPPAIDAKLVYLEYLRKVPEDKLGEMQSKLRDAYDEHQLAKSMENAKVKSESELDAKLRELGSSVEKQRRQFSEMVLAQQLLKEKVDPQIDVTREDLVRYYEEHREKYRHAATVKWEQLATRADRFESPEAARQALARMGNDVHNGRPWHEVARESSQGLTADKGGQHDWTEKGSLVSTVLDEALFSLPVNQMSRILEDNWGFHIVRVIERKEEAYDPFTEVQHQIKEEITKERSQQARNEFIAKLRKSTYIWTVFDGDPAPK